MIQEDHIGTWSSQEDGVVRVILKKTRRCPLCHRMVCFVINRDGATRCVECDQHYLLRK